MSRSPTATPPHEQASAPQRSGTRPPTPRHWHVGALDAATYDLIAGGISRRDLARNRWVWTATAGGFAVFATACALGPFVFAGLHHDALWGVAALLTAIAVVIVVSAPVAIGTVANHVLLASVYVSVVITMWAFQPEGSVATIAAMFIGPLTAVRLVDRCQIGAHLLAATVAVSILPLLGLVDRGTLMAWVVLIPSMWVFAGATVVLLEAIEFQSDELELLVRRDPLTGVGNRRMLTERLDDELDLHRRAQRPLSLVALDLNGFKALNDTVGHAAGDQLLRDVAGALVHAVGPHDTVVRQGGDEFCLIMVNTSAGEAVRTIDTVRAALHAFDAQAGVPITVGAGIAAFPRDADNAERLLHCADERMRADKSGAPGPLAAPPSPAHAVHAVDAALGELAAET